ncbi:MAG: hypothetical protein R3Y09_07560 [Clostridia bacterium]
MREFLAKKFDKILGIDADEIIIDPKIMDIKCVKCEGRIDSKYCDGRCVDELDDEPIYKPKISRCFDIISSLFMTLAATLSTAYMVNTNYPDQVSNLFVFCILYFVAMFVPIFGIRCFFSAMFNKEES